jgi:hypothetical protein
VYPLSISIYCGQAGFRADAAADKTQCFPLPRFGETHVQRCSCSFSELAPLTDLIELECVSFGEKELPPGLPW